MKIVYFIEENVFTQSGVIEKIANQIKCLSEQAVVIPLGMKSLNENRNALIDNCILISPRFKIKNQFLNKLFCEKALIKKLNELNPDIIYLRQSIWNPIYLKLFSNYKCYLEVNSLDINELKYFNFLKKAWYLSGRKWILKKAHGIIAVSNEIKTSLSIYKQKVLVISNGINYEKYLNNNEFDKGKEYSNQRPQVIFSGSLSQKWQGVEKVFLLAQKIKSCDFHCVGFSENIIVNEIPNLFLYNRLSKIEHELLIKKMDIGIGTLSLYEKEMDEASPLKVREYIENHLYVILAYYDTDFSENEYDFVLQLPNNKTNVINNIIEIEKFILKNYKKRIEKNLFQYSTQNKENEKITFFKKDLSTIL